MCCRSPPARGLGWPRASAATLPSPWRRSASTSAVHGWYCRDELAGVTTVDMGWGDAHGVPSSAAYVVKRPNHRMVSVVAGGSASQSARLLNAVGVTAGTTEDVRMIILPGLTEIWGALALGSTCRNATMVAHPRACRHLVDPARAVDADVALLGADGFHAIAGMPAGAARTAGLDPARVRPAADGER